IKTTNMGAAWTSDKSHTINDLKGAVIIDGTSAFVAGNKTTILYTANSALPVELISFNAQRQAGNAVGLFWKVASEVNNAYYSLDRMQDGYWEHVDDIEGKGTTTVPCTYHYLDTDPLTTPSVYRLRQTDLDGSEHVLGTAEADGMDISQGHPMGVTPNPTSTIALIS